MLRREFVEEVLCEVRNLLPTMDISTQEVTKNNDCVLNAIMIRRGNCSIVPSIYIENYLKDESKAKHIASEIVETYMSIETPREIESSVDTICNFLKVKSKLRIRLLNKNNNRKYLEDVPYKAFLDMAMIAVVELESTVNGTATVKVTNDLLDKWNTSVDEVMEIARKNTFSIPYEFKTMAEMLGLPAEFNDFKPFPMYILTNTHNNFGAVHICNISTMAAIADKLKSDLVVLPSSVHEVIILKKDKEMDVDNLTQTVREINSAEVSPDEILSDHAYIFTRESGWEI